MENDLTLHRVKVDLLSWCKDMVNCNDRSLVFGDPRHHQAFIFAHIYTFHVPKVIFHFYCVFFVIVHLLEIEFLSDMEKVSDSSFSAWIDSDGPEFIIIIEESILPNMQMGPIFELGSFISAFGRIYLKDYYMVRGK